MHILCASKLASPLSVVYLLFARRTPFRSGVLLRPKLMAMGEPLARPQFGSPPLEPRRPFVKREPSSPPRYTASRTNGEPKPIKSEGRRHMCVFVSVCMYVCLFVCPCIHAYHYVYLCGHAKQAK